MSNLPNVHKNQYTDSFVVPGAEEDSNKNNVSNNIGNTVVQTKQQPVKKPSEHISESKSNDQNFESLNLNINTVTDTSYADTDLSSDTEFIVQTDKESSVEDIISVRTDQYSGSNGATSVHISGSGATVNIFQQGSNVSSSKSTDNNSVSYSDIDSLLASIIDISTVGEAKEMLEKLDYLREVILSKITLLEAQAHLSGIRSKK